MGQKSPVPDALRATGMPGAAGEGEDVGSRPLPPVYHAAPLML